MPDVPQPEGCETVEAIFAPTFAPTVLHLDEVRAVAGGLHLMVQAAAGDPHARIRASVTVAIAGSVGI